MPTLRQALEARWLPTYDKDRLAAVWINFVQALNAADTIEKLSADISANARLSALGKIEEVRSRIATEMSSKLHRLQKANETALANIEKA